MMSDDDDNDGQMVFGDLGTFVLQVRKTPKKTSTRKLVPTGDRTRARYVTGGHATACSTASSNGKIGISCTIYNLLIP